jgi:myo-inositol catabolism protein IolC/protein-S-isoprenylcysteine O-methyltransferase Ste14
VNEPIAHSGVWALALIMIVAASWLVYRYLAPKTWREWAGAGLVQAFIIALYAEMYGFPLTIYLLVRFFGLDRTHLNANLWSTLIGAGETGMLVSMVLGYGLVFVGIGLFIQGWRELYRAQKEKRLATDGLYGLVRHPQYTGLFVGLFGEGVVHWPTVFSVGLFPLIVLAYVLLARSEERRMVTAYGEAYRGYRLRVPMFWPRWGHWRQLVEGARMSDEGESSHALDGDAHSDERPRVRTWRPGDHQAPPGTRGYMTPLYILPFDHRASFERGLFGWSGTLGVEQTARIVAAKRVIYDGFVAAVAGGVPKAHAGILVDEQFGAAILADASRTGFITCASVEKSGQEEFDFEFGDEFARHIENVAPTFAKVLVRYHPDGDAVMNRRQAGRLRRLSEYLEGSPSKYMFELLVPATRTDLHAFGGKALDYDRRLLPWLMTRAIRELQNAGVEPDVWKIEGLDRPEDDARIVETVRRDGRGDVGCIVLGRGESDPHVRTWLATAATVPGFIGVAVGRTTFWEPLVALRDGTISRETAVAEIARRYRQWVDVFTQSRGAARSPDFTPRTPSTEVLLVGRTQ